MNFFRKLRNRWEVYNSVTGDTAQDGFFSYSKAYTYADMLNWEHYDRYLDGRDPITAIGQDGAYSYDYYKVRKV